MLEILYAVGLVGGLTIAGFAGAGGIPALIASSFSTYDAAKVRFVTTWDNLKRPIRWENNREYKLRRKLGITDQNVYAGWQNSGFDNAYNFLEYTRVLGESEKSHA